MKNYFGFACLEILIYIMKKRTVLIVFGNIKETAKAVRIVVPVPIRANHGHETDVQDRQRHPGNRPSARSGVSDP